MTSSISRASAALRQVASLARRARTLAPLAVLTAILHVPRTAEAEPKPSVPTRPAKPGPQPPTISAAVPPSTAPAASGPTSGGKGSFDAFATVAERVAKGVVQIDVVSSGPTSDDPSEPTAHRRGLGSGIVLSAEGVILTNDHVIGEAAAVTVRFADGRALPAVVAGRDPDADLAVLRVDARDLSPVKMADSDLARVGEWVVAIGAPFGLGQSVTAGVLSAKGRGGLGSTGVDDFLQTDATIHPGSSGGPLVNLAGEVVGINTMILGQGGGIGFAVPSNLAKRIAETLLAHGRVERPFVGMHLQDLTPELADELKVSPGMGALVSSVASGGPADKAHVKPGDVILESAGKRVMHARDLVRDLLASGATATLPLVVSRGGTTYRTDLTLVARQETARPRSAVAKPSVGLGLTLRDRVEPAGLVGSAVIDVAPGSPADRGGLRGGDLLVEADGKLTPDGPAMTEAARDGKLLLRVRRGDRFFYVALRRDAPGKPGKDR